MSTPRRLDRDLTQHEVFIIRRALRYEIARLTEKVTKLEKADENSALTLVELADAQSALKAFD